MAMETIRTVTKTEDEVRQRRDAALSQAKQQVAQAQKQVQALLEERRRDAEAQAAELMRQAEDAAAKTAEEILATARKECEALKEEAGKRLPQAAQRIVEKVVKG